MIIGRNYIFLHVPKTGGTWIRAALRMSGTVEQEFKDHRAFCDLPEDIKKSKRQVFAFVRNPWDWYISLYTHYHHNYTRGIHEFLGPESNWSESSKFLAERFGGSFGHMLEHMDDSDSLTRSISKISEGCDAFTLLRYEDGLSEGLLSLLGNSFNAHATRRIQQMSGSRFNSHSHHRQLDPHYDPSLSLIVMARESSIVDRFGYLPPLHSRLTPVILLLPWSDVFGSSK